MTTINANAVPEMTDADWAAIAEALDAPQKGNAGPTAEEKRARDDERRRALNPGDPPITRERDAQPLADLLGVPVEKIAPAFPTADEIVAAQRAKVPDPPSIEAASSTPPEMISPELAEIRVLRAELHDLTSLVLSLSKRMGNVRATKQ
jgi:hypothetical protein